MNFTIRTLIIILILIALLITISIFAYKNLKNGNNTTKTEEEIIQNILNIKTYKATMKIEINTNKNKTKYMVKQSLDNNKSIQEIIEPQNIAGVKTEYDGQNLKIVNNVLGLTTTYENYTYIVNNNWWLNSIIEEYKNSENTKVEQKNNEIILEIKDEKNNKYNTNKKLYIDKSTGKPTKIIVQDINQNILIYILYTEIEIS